MRLSSNRRRSLALAGCTAVLATSCTLSPAGLNVGDEPDAAPSAGPVAPPRSPPASPEGLSGDGAAGTSLPPPDAGQSAIMADAATGAGPQQDGAPPSVTPDATPAVAVPPDAALPPDAAPVIVRAHNVVAGRIVAGVVYARRIDAKSGTIARAGDPLPDALLAAQIGRMDLKASELVVDVLYAQEVQADRVEIAEAHASSLKIDKPDP